MTAVRPTLLDIKEKDLAILEMHFTPGWTEVLRDFAISLWITLLNRSNAKHMAPAELAELAVQLAMGIAEDLGGTQPYIPIGVGIHAEQRKAEALRMLVDGFGYAKTAKACGLTVSRVRKIEREERAKNSPARNSAIPSWRDEAQMQTDAVDADGDAKSTRPTTVQNSVFPALSGI